MLVVRQWTVIGYEGLDLVQINSISLYSIISPIKFILDKLVYVHRTPINVGSGLAGYYL